MNFIRNILFPFAILYDWVTQFRNFLYDKNFLKSYRFSVPIIIVGNLSVGGTGKTPQIEYLIRLLSINYKIATLSRGYKRSSKGFVLASPKSDAKTLGDEPYQFYKKFKNILVAVDSDRKNGIEQLLLQPEKPEIVLLDDAFQHRKVRAGLYILLTSYGDFFYDDYLLPTGNLRENKNGLKRANIVVVTKCPPTISELEQNKIIEKIGSQIPVYFSYTDYDTQVFSENESFKVSEIKSQNKLLIAGIANPKPFFDFLKSRNDFILSFPDHHNFSENDIKLIKSKAQDNPIITTEKDYVRLKNTVLKNQLYYLPIKSSFVSGSNRFNKNIIDYVEQSTRNL